MRRIACGIMVAGILAGCGTSDVRRSANPQSEGLRAFPAGTAAVGIVRLQAEGGEVHPALEALRDAADVTPAGAALEGAIEAFESAGIELREVVDALEGVVVVGAVGMSQLRAGDLQASAPGVPEEVEGLVERAVAAGVLEARGEHRGAVLYEADGAAVGMRDGVVLVAGSTPAVRGMLDVRDGGDEAQLDDGRIGGLVDRLADDAPAVLVADAAQLIGELPGPGTVRSLPAFAAIEHVAATVEPSRRDPLALDVDFVAESDLAVVDSEHRLPLDLDRTGQLAGPLGLAVGHADAETALGWLALQVRSQDPAAYSQARRAVLSLAMAAGVDEPAELLREDSGIQAWPSDEGGILARVELAAPEAVARALQQVAGAPRRGVHGPRPVAGRDISVALGGRGVVGVAIGAGDPRVAAAARAMSPRTWERLRGSVGLGTDPSRPRPEPPFPFADGPLSLSLPLGASGRLALNARSRGDRLEGRAALRLPDP